MAKSKSKNTRPIERRLKNFSDRYDAGGRKIVFSFRDFDRNQGQSFSEWQDEKLLALAIDKISQLSQLTIAQAQQQKILKIYTKIDFPPKSKFTYPKIIKEGVLWASFHIQGKECIIGHIEGDVFHIVFLDKEHEFWISEKKHT